MYTPRTQRNPEKISLPLQRFLLHPVILTLWTLLCLGIGLQLIRSALSSRQAFSTQAEAEKLLKQEEEKGAKLMDQVRHADEDFSQEKIIRDELNMQQPGDIILHLPSPTP